MLDAKRERPRAISVANQQGGSVVVHLTKRSRAEKLGLSLVEDESGRVLILKIYPEYVAATAGLLVRHAKLSSVERPPGCWYAMRAATPIAASSAPISC